MPRSGFADRTSERLVLRGVTLDDVPLIVQWKSDPLVKAMALDPATVIDEDGQRRDVERAISSADEIYGIICLKGSGQPIGYVRANFMDDAHEMVWLRFALGSHRGQGHMREALRAFIGQLFENGVNRIEGEVYATNERSLALMEKLGFKIEGKKRQAHFDGTGYVDVCVYGLLRKEWQP